jgi:hypothetical protein
MLRIVTKSDIPDLMRIARARYGDFDQIAAKAWAERAIGQPDALFIRSDHAFGVAAMQPFFYNPDVEHARLVFLASSAPNPWAMEPYHILHDLVVWAKNRGAQTFSFGSDTGVDFGPFAKRLNACKDVPSYTVTFGGQRGQEVLQ